MDTVEPFGPEHQAIDDQWTEFFQKYSDLMPKQATSLTLGAVFLGLLDTFKPPLEEIAPIMLATIRTYAEMVETPEGYIN